MCGAAVADGVAVVVVAASWYAELVRVDAGAGAVAGVAVEMVQRRSASLLLWLLVRRSAVEVGGGRRRDGEMMMQWWLQPWCGASTVMVVDGGG